MSRHRQWRAWQFGRRHSGMFRGGGGEEYIDPKAEKWFLIILGVYGALLLVFWFVWPIAASYMLTAMIVLGIIGWIMKIFFL